MKWSSKKPLCDEFHMKKKKKTGRVLENQRIWKIKNQNQIPITLKILNKT